MALDDAQTAVLADELTLDPLARGYAAMTDREAADDLNAPARPARRRVALGDLHQYIDNLADGGGVPVWEAIESNQADAGALGVACRAALRLRGARADYPPVNLDNAMVQGQLDGLVTGGVLSAAQKAGILALGDTTVSRAAELGLPGLGHLDIARARGG
jgi:hypothetical protein